MHLLNFILVRTNSSLFRSFTTHHFIGLDLERSAFMGCEKFLFAILEFSWADDSDF